MFALLIVLSVTAGASATVEPSPKPQIRPVSSRRHNWEDTYFGGMDRHLKWFDLQPLRNYTVPPGDIEVRVWTVSSGIPAEDAVVFKRTRGIWSAMLLHAAFYVGDKTNDDDDRIIYFDTSLPAPKSGWAKLWNRLNQNDLFTLPDQSEIEESAVCDGWSLIVEINRDGFYRTYNYGSPEYSKRSEDKKALAICKMLEEQFDLKKVRRKDFDDWKKHLAETTVRPSTEHPGTHDNSRGNNP